jgi:hypothetical protein
VTRTAAMSAARPNAGRVVPRRQSTRCMLGTASRPVALTIGLGTMGNADTGKRSAADDEAGPRAAHGHERDNVA